MTTYSPTNAAEIITAINSSAASGDVVVLPDGTWDCTAATLSPAAGVTIRGGGRDACSVQAVWLVEHSGSDDVLTLEDFECDVDGLAGAADADIGYSPLVFGECTLTAFRMRFVGPNSGSYVSMFRVRSNTAKAIAVLRNCKIANASGDVLSCWGDNTYGPSSSTTLYDCHVSGTTDGGASVQLITTHNDHVIRMYGGTVDDSARTDSQAAIANGVGASGLSLSYFDGVSIIGGVGDGAIASNCIIKSRAGLSSLCTPSSSQSQQFYGCRIINRHAARTSYPRSLADGVTHTFESCLFDCGGYRGVNIVLECNAGALLVYKNCRFTNCTRAIELGHTESFGLHVENCIVDDTDYYFYDTGSRSVSISGGYNTLGGSQEGTTYSAQTGDVFTEPQVDSNGRPTIGGNLDGAANQSVSMSSAIDCYGQPRSYSTGTVCRGPVDTIDVASVNYADRVKEATETTGTGTYSLAGASDDSTTFVAAIGDEQACHYCCTDGTDWEVGIGVITDAATDTISREIILASSNDKMHINWGSGEKSIFCVIAADDARSFLLVSSKLTTAEAAIDALEVLVDQDVTNGSSPSFDGITLATTTTDATGVIWKAGTAFIHNFQHPTGDTAVPVGENTFVGVGAGNFTAGSSATATDDGSKNVAVGYKAGEDLTIGAGNTLIGWKAGLNVTEGLYNVAIGGQSLSLCTTGDYNFSLGYNSLSKVTTASNNVAVGGSALANCLSNDNVAIGQFSGYRPDGTRNVFIGSNAGMGASGATGVNYNVCIGYDAGKALATGADSNILLGYKAGEAITTGDDNIVIGVDCETSSATASNELNIGNTIYGDLSNQLVGIGETSPDSALHIDGAITLNEMASDPSDPATGSAVLWLDAAGDLKIKINHGGTTKTATLADFSEIPE